MILELKQINKLESIIKSMKCTVLTLDTIYLEVSRISKIQVNDLKNIYYDDFYNLINELVSRGVFVKYGKDRTNINPPLYKKYKILKEAHFFTSEDEINKTKLNKLNLKYYNKRVLEFREDYDILLKLNDILRNKDKYTDLSLNELSYEIFGYEKEMSDSDYKVYKIMKKIGLKSEDIGCRLRNNPLLNTIFRGFYENKSRNVLIVENLDTYWTLNRYLRENPSYIDMLVWGCGYDITKNFNGLILYGVNNNDSILYYGDIDLEGVLIFKILKERYSEYNIFPCVTLYTMLLKSGKEKGINKSVSQNHRCVEDCDIEYFLKNFSTDDRDVIENVLKNRQYIPQESLNYIKLRGEYIE